MKNNSLIQIGLLWEQKQQLVDMCDVVCEHIISDLSLEEKMVLNGTVFGDNDFELTLIDGRLMVYEPFLEDPTEVSDLYWDEKYALLEQIHYKLKDK